MKNPIRIAIGLLLCIFFGIGGWNFWRTHAYMGLPQFRKTIEAQALWDAAAQEEMAQCEAVSHTPMTTLTQKDNGEGVVIGEPLADKASIDFGAGCARWLQLALGGLGSCGKNPSWDEIDGARQERRFTTFRLVAADVKPIAKMLGATRIALGTLTSANGHYRLSYGWVRGDDGQALGDAVFIEGSLSDIASHLPELADKLAGQLKLSNPQTIATGTSSELAEVGRWPRRSQDQLSDAQTEHMMELAGRLPLAAITLLHNNTLDNASDYRKLTDSLMQLAPGNPMALKAVAQFCADRNWLSQERTGWLKEAELTTFSAALNRESEQYPNNYLLNSAKVRVLHAQKNIPQERRSAEDAVRCAARNPYAWCELGDAIYDMADSVRHERSLANLYPPQHQFVSRTYVDWQRAADHAVLLDSRNALAWLKLSRATGFGGTRQMAAQALGNSLRLDWTDYDAYWWALEFNQPKWSGKQKLNMTHLMKFIESRPALTRKYYGELQDALDANGMSAESHEVELDSIAFFTREIATNPADAYYQLGYIYNYNKRYQEATDAFQKYLKLKVQPRNAEHNANVCFSIGSILQYRSHRFQDAQVFYDRALAFNPEFGDVYNAMADIQQASGKLPESEPLYKKAILYSPNQGYYRANLGNLYLNENRYREAVAEAKKAMALGTTEHELFDNLGWKK